MDRHTQKHAHTCIPAQAFIMPATTLQIYRNWSHTTRVISTQSKDDEDIAAGGREMAEVEHTLPDTPMASHRHHGSLGVRGTPLVQK